MSTAMFTLITFLKKERKNMSTSNLWLCYGVTSLLPLNTNIGHMGIDTKSPSSQGCFSHLHSVLFMLAASINWVYLEREAIFICLNI